METSETEPLRGAFWSALDVVDSLARKDTLEFIERGGAKAPAAWDQLGTCLALLDAAGSCRWGCAGGDHVVERRERRAVRPGYQTASYDEALNMLRTAAEVTNLLTVFAQDVDAG